MTAETILSIAIGLGLAASCGFRIFVPLLVMNLGAMAGQLTLIPPFEWVGGPYALMAFGAATVLEIVAYYVPWFDNLLDAIATPVAAIAGVMVTASVIGEMSPFLRWTLAVIAGGGIVVAVQGGTVLLRATSSMTTAGSGNALLSTGELFGSLLTSILAITAPIICLFIVLMTLGLILRYYAFAPGRPPAEP